MNFQQLKYHLEDNACTFDHYEDDSYWVANVLNDNVCIVEHHNEYSIVTLCHYFYELKVPSPQECKEDFEEYCRFREKIAETEALTKKMS